MTNEQHTRMNELADKFRMNRISAAEVDELDALEMVELQSKIKPAEAFPPLDREPGWWTLPVAESCWNADARHVER